MKVTPERKREIARLGGLAVSRDRAHMSRIGKIGGMKVSQDRAHMSRIGKIGGARSAMLKLLKGKRDEELQYRSERGTTAI